MQLLIPTIAFAVIVPILVSRNLTCHVFYRPGSTTTLAFSFGWPVPYLDGSVPGPGIRAGVGPNYVWGHPEMNDRDDIMASIREQYLSDLSLTPWGMQEYGKLHLWGLLVDALCIIGVWPITFMLWLGAVRAASRRRQARLRLKPSTVMTLLVLLGIAISWGGIVFIKARGQRSAIADIREIGGRVYYPYQTIEPFEESLLSTLIRNVQGSEYVYSLVQVNLNGTRTTDHDVQALSRLGTLEGLNLSGTDISDSALATLCQLDDLKELNAEGTAISDVGLQHLAGCDQLGYLWLRGTKVSNSGIPFIVRLQGLKTLDVRETQISASGVEQIRHGLPAVEIYHESQPGALARLPRIMQQPLRGRLTTGHPPASSSPPPENDCRSTPNER